MASIGDLFYTLRADDSKLEADIVKAGNKGADKAGQQSGQAFGSKFSGAFQKTTTVAGAAAGTLFVGAIGGATEFEQQLRVINTVAHLTDGELKGVGASILGLSKESGKSTADLTQGFYDLVSAGIPAKEAINVLRDSAKFATGALSTTGEAVDVVTSALNAYGLSADKSTRVTDIFAQAVADGKVTAAELGSSISNIAPIAASAGISLEQVSAGFAILTAKGVPAAQAATEMRAAISALLTPNTQLNHLMGETGLNFAALAKEKGLAVALQTLRKTVGDNAVVMGQLAKVSAKDFPAALLKANDTLGLTQGELAKFSKLAGKQGVQATLNDLRVVVGAGDEGFAKALGSVEAYQFALATTGDNASAYATELGKVTDAAGKGGVAQGQYDEVMKSSASQGQKLVAQIHALGVQIGGPFVDSLGPAVIALGGMGQGLSGIFNLASLVGGGLGALAGKLIGVFIPAIVATAPAAATAGEAVGAATAGGIGIGALLLPAILIGAIVAAIAVLVANPELRDKAISIGSQVVKFIGDGVATIIRVVPPLIQKFVGQAIDAVSAWVPAAISGLVAALPGIADALGQFLQELPGRIADAVALFVPAFLGWIVQVAPQIPAALGTIGAAILTWVSQIAPSVAGALLSVGERLMGWLVSIGQSAVAMISGILAALPGIALNMIVAVAGFILSLPGRILALQVGILEKFWAIAAGAVTAIAGMVPRVVGFILGIPGRIAGMGPQLVAFFGQAAANIVTTISKLVGDIVTWLMSIPGKLVALGGNIVKAIIDGLASLPDKLGHAIHDAFMSIFPINIGPIHITANGITVDMPHFAAGTSYVLQDTVAMVHKGEMIIPAAESAAIRAGRSPVVRAQMSEAATGGNTYVVQVEGVIKATTPHEIGDALRRLSDFGVLP